MELFIIPEIKDRQAKNELPRPLDLHAGQIIFFPDGRSPLVRINNEVKAIGKIKLKNNVKKNVGDPIYESEVEGLENAKLMEDDFQDCGHATLIKFGDIWTITFDFSYNKDLSKKHLDTAIEFYELAEFAHKKNHWSAFIDNSFSAVELTAKAILLGMPDKDLLKKATHKGIHVKFNRFASLGNVKEEHKDVFNKLHRMRGIARYLKKDLALSETEADEIMEMVKEMIDIANGRLKVSNEI